MTGGYLATYFPKNILVPSSLLLHTKIPLLYSFFGRRLVRVYCRILSAYLLAFFHLMKKSAKGLRKPSSEPAWETQNCPPNIKCLVPALFGDRLEGKEGGLRTYGIFRKIFAEMRKINHTCKKILEVQSPPCCPFTSRLAFVMCCLMWNSGLHTTERGPPSFKQQLSIFHLFEFPGKYFLPEISAQTTGCPHQSLYNTYQWPSRFMHKIHINGPFSLWGIQYTKLALSLYA
jgi:hypothetical protein